MSAWDAEGIPGPVAVPSSVLPFEVFPSPTAVPRHRGLCPLAVASFGAPRSPLPMLLMRDSEGCSTSRPCSVAESVAACLRFQIQAARYFLGLMVRQAMAPVLHHGPGQVEAPEGACLCRNIVLSDRAPLALTSRGW